MEVKPKVGEKYLILAKLEDPSSVVTVKCVEIATHNKDMFIAEFNDRRYLLTFDRILAKAPEKKKKKKRIKFKLV
jgi:hypothetical protein